jgi:hypothetical protein
VISARTLPGSLPKKFPKSNLAVTEALVESINTPTTIQNLLFPGIERMALGTDFNQYVFA